MGENGQFGLTGLVIESVQHLAVGFARGESVERQGNEFHSEATVRTVPVLLQVLPDVRVR